MTKKTKTIAWTFYLIGLALALMGFLAMEANVGLYMLTVGAAMIIVPWVMCMADVYKYKDSALWLLFLFMMGSIAIPVYMIRSQTSMAGRGVVQP